MAEAVMSDRTRIAEVCRYLRTKSLFIPADERGNRALVEASETAHYWCSRTGAASGPDHETAGPSDCEAERACYVGMPVVLKEIAE